VLLLDEHCPKEGSACEVWAIDPLGNLADVASQRLTLDGAEVEADAACTCCRRRPAWQPRDRPARAVARRRGHRRCGLRQRGPAVAARAAADDLLVVLKPHPASVTAAYAGIKNLHYAHGLKQLRFLINGVVDTAAARQIMNNLANAGSRYLALSLLPAGWCASTRAWPMRGG
jgi:flagellar biosynthesis protein FlhG